MASSRCVLFVVVFGMLGCQGSHQGPSQGFESGSDPHKLYDSTGDVTPYPIFVSQDSAPAGTLVGLDEAVSNVVATAKGLVPNGESDWCDPFSHLFWCLPDASPWIAKVRVLKGPLAIHHDELSGYPVGGGLVQFGIWREWRHYAVEVVEAWLGKPSRTEYQLWDLGGYCPGDFQYCPSGTTTAEECLRIQGKMPDVGTCEYRHPETGELLVLISGLDVPSGLEPGAEFILFGADAIEGLTESGLSATLKGIGADPGKSTLTGAERLLYRTEGDQVDVIYLAGEDFPGSPGGYIGYAGPRWVPLRLLARRILDRIVAAYLDDHPEDRPYVEDALSGLLLEEYLNPTPDEPEEPSLTLCPEDAVAASGAKCKGAFTCHSGKVTCCGEAYSRENCICNKLGSPKDELECVVVNETSCFGGACPPQFCLLDEHCPPGSRCFPVIHPSPIDAEGYVCVPSP